MNYEGALEGVLVIDHTTALAGPYCAQMLGDLGAEVIKIERPGSGDMSRGWGPPFVAGESAYFVGTNRNKRSLTLNLGTEPGRGIFHKLIQKADVFLHNVPKAKSRKKLGVDAETCHALNNRLIWAAISGFGNNGPMAERPGYDVIVQAMSGTMHLTGDPDGEPARFPTAIADITTGLYTALAIVSALFARTRSGKGQVIDMALLDSQVTWLANVGSGYLMTGDPPQKKGNAHANITTYQPFPTSDGWIIVGAGSERLWQRWTAVLERPDLAEDLRFRTNPDRVEHREMLVPILNDLMRQRTTAEWEAKLIEADIPNGVIQRPENSLQSDQLYARDMIVTLDHPTVGSYKTIGNPINLFGNPITYRRPAPLLGEHNHEILHELNYSPSDIEDFQQDGVV